MKNHEKLIKGCIKSDRASQKEFYKLFYPRLMAISLRMSPNKEVARDLLQDSFIKIFSRLKTLNGYDEALVYSWCKSVVTNTIIDFLRKPDNKISFIELDNNNNEYGEETKSYDFIPEKEYDESLIHYKNLAAQDIVDAIDSLTPSYKAVFNLVNEGYTHPEIARMLDIGEGTSKSNYHRGRVHLMKKLETLGDIEKQKLELVW